MGCNARKFTLSCVTLAVIVLTTTVFHLTQTFSKDLGRGQRWFHRGRYRVALLYLNAAARMRPLNRDVLTYLAVTYDKLNQKKDVLQQLEKLVHLDNRDLKTTLWLADVYYELGYFDKAERAYQEILTYKKSLPVYMKLAEVLAWQEKYDQAVYVLEQFPEDPACMEILADVYAWHQQYDQAIGLYTQLAESPGVDPEVILKLADTLRFAKRNREAVVRYRQYLGLYDAL